MRLFPSAPPDVNIISFASAPKHPAIIFLVFSIIPFAFCPNLCVEEGFA